MKEGHYNIAIANFGCRANFSDTELIEDRFLQYPQTKVFEHRSSSSYKQVYDAVVINTCTITEAADKECRAMIRRFSRQTPKPLIAVVGCYASRAPKEVLSLEGVDQVFSTKHKLQVTEWIAGVLGLPSDSSHLQTDLHAKRRHSRAFVKVQDGCQDYCAFCIVPFARGGLRSIPISEIKNRCATLVKRGIKEVVLTGINIGRWGMDMQPQQSFVDVMKVVTAFPGIHRVRLSSIDPMDVTEELLDVMKSSKTALPSFHLPIQSGPDSILAAMGRRYVAADVETRVKWITSRFPDATIGCDVMVGFPGETEDDFLQTVNLMKSLPLTKLHVFPYSIRPGTKAAQMPNQLPQPLKHERVAELVALSEQKLTQSMEAFVNQHTDVLIEDIRNGHWRGYSHNYLPVYGEVISSIQPNDILKVHVRSLEPRPSLTYPISLFGIA